VTFVLCFSVSTPGSGVSLMLLVPLYFQIVPSYPQGFSILSVSFWFFGAAAVFRCVSVSKKERDVWRICKQQLNVMQEKLGLLYSIL